MSDKFRSNLYFRSYRSGFGQVFSKKAASVGIGQPFLENDITNQHHLWGVNTRSLGRQLTLYGGENQSRILTYDKFYCFLKDCCIFRCVIMVSFIS